MSNGEITPLKTKEFLEREGAELLRSGGEHYYVVRERFNREGAPLDFLFLNRACFNGLIRFNQSGGFNVPFCKKPNRFAQAYITKISNQVQTVANVCALGTYEFRCQDYSATISEAQNTDILYCDPPYIERHSNYFNGWEQNHEKKLAELLFATAAKFILSTWLGNKFRKNEFIDTIWADYNVLTKEHFYHIGARENNRNQMLEALVTNFQAHYEERVGCVAAQDALF